MFMVKATPVGQSKREWFGRGFYKEFDLQDSVEPLARRYKVTASAQDQFGNIGPELVAREDLKEALRRETDASQAFRLLERIGAIEFAWNKRGVAVKRVIRWPGF